MEKKPLYHYKEGMSPSEKPAWAKEVSKRTSTAYTYPALSIGAIMSFSCRNRELNYKAGK